MGVLNKAVDSHSVVAAYALAIENPFEHTLFPLSAGGTYLFCVQV